MLLLTILALVASAVVSLWTGNVPLALFCGAWAIVLPLIEWGFACPKGWRHWRLFVDERDHGKVGRGCD